MEGKFAINIDRMPWRSKPSGRDMGAIRARLGEPSAIVETGPEGLCEAVRRGQTFTCALFDGKGTRKENFVSQRLFALDFDGKPPLDPVDALDRAYSRGIAPMMLYFTLRSSLDAPRYRMVFEADEALTDVADAEATARWLLDLFPEADPACKDATRMYLGSNGEVWECYELA